MPTIDCRATTSLPAERVVAALTDFSPARPELWPSLDPSHYAVHERGETWADVTEGAGFAGGVWERGRYDWSSPGLVRFEVADSNAFAAGSSWEYRLRADPSGAGTVVELTVSRRAATPKGRVLTLLMRIGGRRALCGDLRRALAALEAR
jgi:hypothetical protein